MNIKSAKAVVIGAAMYNASALLVFLVPGVLPLLGNGIIRLTFVVVVFALDFASTVGTFITRLAIGDFFLGILCVFGIPRVLRKSHLQLLTNR